MNSSKALFAAHGLANQKYQSEFVFVQHNKSQRIDCHRKARLIERVPEEGHEVDYTRRVEIDKQIAPESVS